MVAERQLLVGKAPSESQRGLSWWWSNAGKMLLREIHACSVSSEDQTPPFCSGMYRTISFSSVQLLLLPALPKIRVHGHSFATSRDPVALVKIERLVKIAPGKGVGEGEKMSSPGCFVYPRFLR